MASTGVHDIGGLEEEFGPIDQREYGFQLWEMQVRRQLYTKQDLWTAVSGACYSGAAITARTADNR